MDYHMHVLEFLSFLKKCGLSFASIGISFPYPKTWTIICNFRNFFPLSKTWTIIGNFLISFPSPKTWTIICNFWKFFPFFKNVDYHMKFLEFLSLLQKHGLSYAIFGISFPSQKMWTIHAIFGNSLPYPKWTIICNFRNFNPF